MNLEEELGGLEDDECEQIFNVIQKNFLLQKTEQDRISKLREETCQKLASIYELEFEASEKRCFICSRWFYRIVRVPIRCSTCHHLLCKRCVARDKARQPICAICAKKNQYASQSNNWFYNRVNSKFEVDASTKVIKSLCRRYKQGSSNSETLRSSEKDNSETDQSENFLRNKYLKSLEEIDFLEDLSLDEAMRVLNLRLSIHENNYLQTSQHVQHSADIMTTMHDDLNRMERQMDAIDSQFPRSVVSEPGSTTLSEPRALEMTSFGEPRFIDDVEAMTSSWIYSEGHVYETSRDRKYRTSDDDVVDTSFRSDDVSDASLRSGADRGGVIENTDAGKCLVDDRRVVDNACYSSRTLVDDSNQRCDDLRIHNDDTHRRYDDLHRNAEFYNKQIYESAANVIDLERQVMLLEEKIHKLDIYKIIPQINIDAEVEGRLKNNGDKDLNCIGCLRTYREEKFNSVDDIFTHDSKSFLPHLVDVEIEVLKLGLQVKQSDKKIIILQDEIIKYSQDKI